MFELDREVRNWRTELEHRSSLSARELDELEDHLRARVTLELELNPALAPAEALAIARKGLGQPNAISREFARAGQPRWRQVLWVGWSMYVASFVLPAFSFSGVVASRPDADLTIYGYELLPEVIGLIQRTPGGLVPLIFLVLPSFLILPNLIFLMTSLSFWRPRPAWRSWTSWLVGLTGAFLLVQGLVQLGDLGPGMQAGVGFWVWSASFLVVAGALWLRGREWSSPRPKPANA
ncbi:MAG: hypothetical protein F4Y74_08635 [Gemmatimonadales bacterium]|nr:hypothetical protein [Gemmatimonadales bacterium]MYG18368.1 hypothetical protein [Gemmatimonadales bacterium]